MPGAIGSCAMTPSPIPTSDGPVIRTGSVPVYNSDLVTLFSGELAPLVILATLMADTRWDSSSKHDVKYLEE